jgi:hypothetical protein
VPNGKPGDHPVTDVVAWKRDVFGSETDALIREIAGHADDYDPFEGLDALFWQAEADRTKTPELHEALLRLLARLRGEGDFPTAT